MRGPRPGFESFRDRGEPAVLRAAGETAPQLRVLFQDARRGPQRLFDLIALTRIEPLGEILVADVASIARDRAVLDFPQRAAAVRTSQRRRRAELGLHGFDGGGFGRYGSLRFGFSAGHGGT